MKRADEIYKDISENGRRIRVMKALEKRHKDKKLVQIGMRLAQNMNVPKELL